MLHKSHDGPIPYPAMQHSVREMWTCVHISVTKCCIVGYLSAPFCNKNVHLCAHLCYEIVHHGTFQSSDCQLGWWHWVIDSIGYSNICFKCLLISMLVWVFLVYFVCFVFFVSFCGGGVFLVAWKNPSNTCISSENCQIWMHQNILLWPCFAQGSFY